MNQKVKNIDVDNKIINMVGNKERIEFDKLLLAFGANKNRLDKPYTNVYYLEDKQSHARIHNELLKANQIVVFGGTFEAY